MMSGNNFSQHEGDRFDSADSFDAQQKGDDRKKNNGVKK